MASTTNTRLRVLADVSHAFAMVATSYDHLLEQIARVTADLIGDGCMVTLLGSDGKTLVNTASAHRDPEIEHVYRDYLTRVGVSTTDSASVSAGVARTGEPKLVAEIAPQAVVESTDAALKTLVARLSVHSFCVVPIRARRTIIGTLSILRSGPGRSYGTDDLVLLQDLADRAGLAIENARLYEDLERRVRERTAELKAVNDDLESFSYSVAHDLRAPLRAIDGYSQLLQESYAVTLDGRAHDHLSRIRSATARMSALIDDLLALAHVTKTALRRSSTDVTALARSVVADIATRDPRSASSVKVTAGLVADGDPGLVRVVLENLLGNACKFTCKVDQPIIEVGQEVRDGVMAFFVRDNGAGFDMAEAGRLFTPFQRLHRQHEFPGTGIGLATVHRIVRRHGGRIWAQATPGQGAVFYFTLPASHPEA